MTSKEEKKKSVRKAITKALNSNHYVIFVASFKNEESKGNSTLLLEDMDLHIATQIFSDQVTKQLKSVKKFD